MKNTSEIVSLARELYHDDVNEDEENREMAHDDLRFATGEGHWTEQARAEREATNRPVITVNRMPQFIRQVTGAADEYQYVNPAHDYPQVITYKPSPGRLDAVISKTGGANPREFLKRTCDGL